MSEDKKENIYPAMTEKELRVLEEAKKLFLDKGIAGCSMADIAGAIHRDRRSLYRLFDSKETIAFHIAISILKGWNDENKRIFSTLTAPSSLQRLEQFLNANITALLENADELKYLSEFDFHFRDDSAAEADAESIEGYDGIVMNANTYIRLLLEEGVKDGSVKPDIDIDLTEATIANVLWSFGQTISIRREVLWSETGINPVEIIRNQVKMYVEALRFDSRSEKRP